MNSSNNRRNHNFQIVHFLVGSCHTADGAYALLCDLREERTMALNSATAAKLREKARAIRASIQAKSEDEAERLEGQAVLSDIESSQELAERNLAAAKAELEFIEQCIEKIRPHRQFSHLSEPEAHEACQREEWRLELEYRAVNFLLTSGTIPHDHFATMRQHPDFFSSILPKINETQELIRENKQNEILTQTKAPCLLLG